MRKSKILFSILIFGFLVLLFLPFNSYSRPPYRPGDWVSYTVLRYVTSIAQGFENIYFGTTGGISRYNFLTDQWTEPLTESDGLLDSRVELVAFDLERNELWVKTYSGVCRYNLSFEDWYYGGDFPYNLVHKDSANFTFPSFFMDFGYSFYPDGYITDVYLNRYKVTDYLFDQWGDLWIGTWGLNAGVASLRYLELEMLKTGLYNEDVKALLLDGDNLWFGGRSFYSQDLGITRYNRKEGRWDYFESRTLKELSNRDVTCMEKDTRYVWFGSTNGLLRYDKRNDRFKSYDSFKGLWNNEVTALKSDEGLLWIGTSWGLNYYLPKRDSLIRVKDDLLKGTHIYSIERDSNFVWIGTDKGAFQLNKPSGEWIPFNIPEGNLNYWVKSIYKYKDELWFGTTDAVIGVNLKTREREIYQSPVNYPGGEVVKIVCDDKNVWVGTILGLWRLDRGRNVWKGFFKEDGLLDNYIQDLLLDGDYLFIGTQRGATRFYWNSPYRID
jgi:ligand-binding sensor domain-containing protein